MTLLLRDATFDDAPLMTELIKAAFEDQRGKMMPPSGAHDETPEKVLVKLEQGGGFIAYVDDSPAGCVVYYPDPHNEDALYFGRLAVLQAYRKHGLGQALIEAVEQKAQALGYAQVTLSVRMALPENRAFFERQGYTITSYESHPGYSEPTFMHMMKRLG